MLRPFPNYRHTNLEWLAMCPQSWDMLRTKQMFRLRIEKAPQNNRMELLSIYTHVGVKPRKDLEQRGNKASTTDGYWIVKKGDIISNKLLAWMGAVGVSHYEGVTSPAYDVLRPIRPCNTDYYHYLFRTPTYSQQFKIRSRGIMDMRLRLYFDQLGQIPIPVPPEDEQKSIVLYLNWKTTQINKFIHNKRRLLELLAERRILMTCKAIQSPETKLLRFGVVADRVERLVSRQSDQIYKPIGLFNRGRGIFHKEPTQGKNLGDSTFYWVKSGDFIFSGQFAWEGAVAIARTIDDDCVASHRYPVFKCKPELVEPAYLYSFFTTKDGDVLLNYHSRGAAGRNRPLNPRTLMKEKIPIPPLHLQGKITEIYESEIKVRREVDSQISFLQEYRNRLIFDIVTGQVDVRGLEVPEVAKEELLVSDAGGGEPDEAVDDELESEAEE